VIHTGSAVMHTDDGARDPFLKVGSSSEALWLRLFEFRANALGGWLFLGEKDVERCAQWADMCVRVYRKRLETP
jgi:hypothetical protein